MYVQVASAGSPDRGSIVTDIFMNSTRRRRTANVTFWCCFVPYVPDPHNEKRPVRCLRFDRGTMLNAWPMCTVPVPPGSSREDGKLFRSALGMEPFSMCLGKQLLPPPTTDVQMQYDHVIMYGLDPPTTGAVDPSLNSTMPDDLNDDFYLPRICTTRLHGNICKTGG